MEIEEIENLMFIWYNLYITQILKNWVNPTAKRFSVFVRRLCGRSRVENQRIYRPH